MSLHRVRVLTSDGYVDMPEGVLRGLLQGLHSRSAPHADGYAAAKCAYCGRYGALGQCAGCGAPNAPVRVSHGQPPQPPPNTRVYR
jgi:hypothetical protein